MKKIIVAIAFLALSGCASVDRYGFVELTDRIDTQADATLQFNIIADAIYPEASPSAEEIRIGWIKETAKDNKLNPNAMEIISRKPVKQSSGWISDIYLIKYTVRIKK